MADHPESSKFADSIEQRHAQLCRIEHEEVASAPITPGVRAAFAAAGTQITVVASLANAAVRTFLVMHRLQQHARHLVGRVGPDPSVLPLALDLITAAIRQRAVPVESCLFVASTDADLVAARAAGIDTIRHRCPHHLGCYRPGSAATRSLVRRTVRTNTGDGAGWRDE